MSYKDSLRAITETGDWTQWISFFLDAAIWQADSNYNAAKAIMEYYAHEVAHSGNDFVKVHNYAVGRDFFRRYLRRLPSGLKKRRGRPFSRS